MNKIRYQLSRVRYNYFLDHVRNRIRFGVDLQLF